jgi:hypothetical protein
MDQKFLSFVIKTLLLKPQPRMYATPATVTGYSMVPQPFDCDLDEEIITEMRDLISSRLADNAEFIADALVELIKRNAQILPTCCGSIMFEFCDDVVTSYRFVMTRQVTSVDPSLIGALTGLLSPCNYPFVPPMGNQSKESMMSTINNLGGYVTGMRGNIEALTQTILSSKTYSPFEILRNCDSKVVIIHDGPHKDKLRAIADDKNMIVLTDPPKEMVNDHLSGYPNQFRPELELLLLINAYNSKHVDNVMLFPKGKKVYCEQHKWASITDYLTMEQYINTADGVRDELARKAPEFLKDFDEDLAVIHKQNEDD